MSSRALPALAKPIAVIALVLIVFALFNDPFRQIEANAAAALLHAFGVAQSAVQARPNASLAVFPSGSGPFLAIVTPACSALSSLLAVAFLGLFVPARYRRRLLPAATCALAVVAVGNIARIAGSVAVGLKAGVASLVLFHDWAGSVFAFTYTLGGYLLMLFILLPATARPDAAQPAGEPVDAMESGSRVG
ncbi:MAG: exosortase/archaeosortase family protein [Pseudonocardiales bacterium]|nr:exosortase/archaeosortase family protein [Pseudonocardiales bacterium]